MTEPAKHDPVKNPSYYTYGSDEIQHIQVAEQLGRDGADFRVIYALKYIWRYARKGNPAQDIRKAIWYLNRLAEDLEAKDVDSRRAEPAATPTEVLQRADCPRLGCDTERCHCTRVEGGSVPAYDTRWHNCY
jgi:hypothetical protein